MEFKDLLRYRNVWLGFAMLWIILAHTKINTEIYALNFIQNIGYGGVDICLFASGIGCYYSLTSDSNAASFLKRRFKRIMPTYIIFIIPWLVYMFLLNQFGWRMAIGNLLAIQYFITGQESSFNWYISAILLLYILAPYFKAIIEKSSFFANLLIIASLIVLSIPFWESTTYIIIITRVPIFYIGMLFGKICQQNKNMKTSYALLLTIMFISGLVMLILFIEFFGVYLWSLGLFWYPFILIAPPLCIAISYFAYFLEKFRIFKPLISIISLIGKYSFEVYLLHIAIISFVRLLINKFELHNTGIFVLVSLISLACLVIGCFILKRMANLFVSLLDRKTHKNN